MVHMQQLLCLVSFVQYCILFLSNSQSEKSKDGRNLNDAETKLAKRRGRRGNEAGGGHRPGAAAHPVSAAAAPAGGGAACRAVPAPRRHRHPAHRPHRGHPRPDGGRPGTGAGGPGGRGGAHPAAGQVPVAGGGGGDARLL